MGQTSKVHKEHGERGDTAPLPAIAQNLIKPKMKLRFKLPWSVAGESGAALGLLVLLFLQSNEARADIWGYVDSERLPHFASTRMDERYELLLRDSEAVEPYTQTDHPQVAIAEVPEQPLPDAPVTFPEATSQPVPLKLSAYFERSASFKALSPLLQEASKTHGIDHLLLQALITTESGFNPSAVSPKGAVGLMQLIPPTAERYGVTAGKNATIAEKLRDPKTNIKAGTHYLADLIKRFPGQLELALAAYNAGEGAVQRAGNKVPNYPETRNYVKNVMQLYNSLATAAFKSAGGR